MRTEDSRSAEPSPTQIKGTVLRGYVQALERLGWLDEVLARVSPEARAVAENLPVDSSWVSMTPVEELTVAVGALHGREGLRRMARESLNQSVIPVLRTLIEGFLRIFGATPASLLSRMSQITASTVKGVDYSWTSTGPDSGTFLIAYPGRKRVPPEMFVGAAASVELAFELCRVRGQVGEPVPSPDHPGYGASFSVRWSKA